MPASAPAFSDAEYNRRLALTRATMLERSLDALFIEDPSNIAWLTGYDGWSFYVHQGVLVLHDSDPIWWGRRMDAEGAKRTVWMDDGRLRSYSDDYVQAVDRHPMQDLSALLRELGLARAAIGVELDNYYYSARAHLTLQYELPEAELRDVTAMVNWLRSVKSDEELHYMRRAARISERIQDVAYERIEPGLPKNRLVADIMSEALRGVVYEGEEIWGDYAAIVPMLPSGPDSAAPHLTWDGRPFKTGEATFFELSGCYRRYHAPFCRTVFLGKPPQDMVDASRAVAEGIEAGLDAGRPGARASDIARGLYSALYRAGLHKEGRCGYAVGMSYPPDWGERTISLRLNDDTVLEPGMTFHFMPGLWTEAWGLEITETIVIREEGPAECLCSRPRELYVKD
ncbi:MAG: M24 family metallopeptidase [Pseudomonadota bacterium]